MTDDLFEDAASEPPYGLHRNIGRYVFPHPETGEKRAWMRVTNLVSAFSDQRALQLWMERMTLLGLLAHEGTIFDELAASGVEYMDPTLQRKMLARFAERARNAVGADAGARRGTARHDMLDGYLSTGEINGHRRMRLQMDSLLEAMEAHDLEFIPDWNERYVWHPAAGGVVGRGDARVLCRHTGRVGYVDLKTQDRFWTYQEHAGQQALYDSARYVWEGPLDDTGRWVPTEENTLRGVEGGVASGNRVALLAHMPQNPGPHQLPVELHELDLDYGTKVYRLAADVVELRSRGKSVAAGRRVGGIRPNPGVAHPL